MMRRSRTSPTASKSETGDKLIDGPDSEDGIRLPVHHHASHRSSSSVPTSSSLLPTAVAPSTTSHSLCIHHPRHNHRILLGYFTSDRVKMVSAFMIGACVSGSLNAIRTYVRTGSSSCQVSFGTYHGKAYDTASRVGSRTCLVESKFLKVQQHQVRLANKDGSSTIIPDWLWIDYHDRINVLVEAPMASSTMTSSQPRFLVFEQTKYALEGRLSLAIVGGIIEPGEEPLRAARREVSEELGVDCQTFHFLGRYRTDVNRGMGWTNAFLASQCQKANDGEKGVIDAASREEEVVGAADSERQDVRTLSFTELKEAVQAGRFLEIQWSATVALAVLHLETSVAAPAP